MRDQTKDKIYKILGFIRNFIKLHGYPPSVREICAGLELKSTSTVHIYLKKMEELRLIEKISSKPRTLHIIGDEDGGRSGRAETGRENESRRSFNREGKYSEDAYQGDAAVYVPVIGRITAGKPVLAEENIEYAFPVPSSFIKAPDSFMLRVEGDSMVNAGIFDRDHILVKSQPTAQNGDIVVALIDDEATVKTYYKERSRIRLQPENERYSPIYATDNCSIVGKVVGIFRKL